MVTPTACCQASPVSRFSKCRQVRRRLGREGVQRLPPGRVARGREQSSVEHDEPRGQLLPDLAARFRRPLAHAGELPERVPHRREQRFRQIEAPDHAPQAIGRAIDLLDEGGRPPRPIRRGSRRLRRAGARQAHRAAPALVGLQHIVLAELETQRPARVPEAVTIGFALDAAKHDRQRHAGLGPLTDELEPGPNDPNQVAAVHAGQMLLDLATGTWLRSPAPT